MNIKGKSYVLVNERIIAFRKVADFKGFALETELLHLDDNSCVVRATIKNEEGRVIAQGMAQEDRSSSMINKTSFVENCETSAVGRALGFLGIGVEDSIATAVEVEMAIAKHDAPSPAAAPAGDVFSRAVDYIKGGKTKPERNTRLENTLKKYGDSLNQDQQNTLYELV